MVEKKINCVSPFQIYPWEWLRLNYTFFNNWNRRKKKLPLNDLTIGNANIFCHLEIELFLWSKKCDLNWNAHRILCNKMQMVILNAHLTVFFFITARLYNTSEWHRCERVCSTLQRRRAQSSLVLKRTTISIQTLMHYLNNANALKSIHCQ